MKKKRLKNNQKVIVIAFIILIFLIILFFIFLQSPKYEKEQEQIEESEEKEKIREGPLSITKIEQLIFLEINEARAKEGLTLLLLDENYSLVAREIAEEMLIRDEFLETPEIRSIIRKKNMVVMRACMGWQLFVVDASSSIELINESDFEEDIAAEVIDFWLTDETMDWFFYQEWYKSEVCKWPEKVGIGVACKEDKCYNVGLFF